MQPAASDGPECTAYPVAMLSRSRRAKIGSILISRACVCVCDYGCSQADYKNEALVEFALPTVSRIVQTHTPVTPFDMTLDIAICQQARKWTAP